jgi:hypothetical protein
MKISFLNFWLFVGTMFFSMELLTICFRTKKLSWDGSLFSLDLCKEYGILEILFVLRFNLYG